MIRIRKYLVLVLSIGAFTTLITLNFLYSNNKNASTVVDTHHCQYQVSNINKNNQNNANKSCLVTILAQTRAWELTWDSFNKHVLQSLNCDLALAVAINKNNKQNLSDPFFKNAKYIWTINEPSNDNIWLKKYEDIHKSMCKNNEIVNKTYCDKNNENLWKNKLFKLRNQWIGPIGHQRGSAGILLYFRYFLKLNIEKLGLINKYKYMMYTRSDHFYCCNHANIIKYEIKYNKNYIWMPLDQNFGGFTDRHLIATSKLFINTLDIIENLFNNTDYFYNIMKNIGDNNLERVIKYHLKNKNLLNKVKNLPRTFYSVRAKNGTTRWRKGDWNEELGFYIKYPIELENAANTCNALEIFS